MLSDTPITAEQAAQSVLGWWLAAGVDCCLEDEPHNQLAAKAPVVHFQPLPVMAVPAVVSNNSDLSLALSVAEDAAKAAQTIEELETAIRAFDGCALKAGATNTVIARGNWDAKLMIIGEAPGADEDRIGRPFVGRSGQLLDKMLAAAGFSTEEVLITNVCYWRPPQNRKPSSQELQLCAPFVSRAIELMKPQVILLAGGSAAQGLLGLEAGILSLRGRWHEWVSPDGVLKIPVMPTLHPAFLLRQPIAKKKAWADILAATANLV